MTEKSSSPKPRNKLLTQSRQWHKWGGLVAALFLIVVGATGMVLNYKKPIFTALGLEPAPKAMKTEAPTGAEPGKPPKHDRSESQFTTVNGFAAATVTPDQALAIARESLGEVALDKIELKDERGEMVYKVKARGGDEVWVNAATGTHFVKGEYEKVKPARDGTVAARTTDWGKIMLDLHTGKIGGEVGKAVMTAMAALLLLLSLSGVYMWAKPLLIRRENARVKAMAIRAPGKSRHPCPEGRPASI